MPTVIYLHGFLSSPQSHKAKVVEQWLLENRPGCHFVCPSLSSYPTLAIAQLKDIFTDIESPFVIGSSLGGYWAAWVNSHFACRAVLVNPAVSPHVRFSHYVGETLDSYYSDEKVSLSDVDLECLKNNDISRPKKPESLKVLLQTGDEVLDYRLAQERYRDSALTVEEGGTHSFTQFERHLPEVMAFFENKSN